MASTPWPRLGRSAPATTRTSLPSTPPGYASPGTSTGWAIRPPPSNDRTTNRNASVSPSSFNTGVPPTTRSPTMAKTSSPGSSLIRPAIPKRPTSSSVRSSDRLRENGWPISHAGSRSSEVGAGVAGSVVAGEAVEAVAVTRTLGAGEGEAAGSSLGSAGAAHAAARTATRHTRHAAVITPWRRAYSRDVARRRTAVIGSEGSANRIQG